MEVVLLDLFSGIGGFHAGLERAGIIVRKAFFSEIEKHPVAIYKHKYPTAIHVGSVTDFREWERFREWRKPTIVTFGSPCQDFSLAGRRRGLGGERSGLVEYAIDIITEWRPDFFVWENVKGVFSSNDGEDFWAVIQALANIGGYRLEWQLLNSSLILPQSRERMYLIGYIAERCSGGILPVREDDFMAPKAQRKNRDEGQVVSTISSTSESKLNLDTTYIRKSIVSSGRGKYNGGEYDTCPTISSSCFELNNHVLEQGTIRRLTEIECERLQGFEDDWTAVGVDHRGRRYKIPKTARYKAIGNAVTVDVVALIGRAIRRAIGENVATGK